MFGLGKKKKNSKDVKSTREELIAQAKENARMARAEIGDETLDKIREAMEKKQNSEIEQRKKEIKALDQDVVADHLKSMLDEKE